jgi:hypothetical protein
MFPDEIYQLILIQIWQTKEEKQSKGIVSRDGFFAFDDMYG